MRNISKGFPISYAEIFIFPLAFLTAEIHCNPLGNPLQTNITHSGGHFHHFHKDLPEEIANGRSTNERSPHFPNGDLIQTAIVQPVVTTENFPLDTADYKNTSRKSSGIFYRELTPDTYASQDTERTEDLYVPYDYTDDSPGPYHAIKNDSGTLDGVPVPIKGVLSSDVTYEDLVALNASCDEKHNCKENRTRDVLGVYGCHCDRSCIELNTCCVDSPFITTKRLTTEPNVKCQKVYGKREIDIFMVDRCKRDWSNDDETTPELCSSNGEDTSDPFLFVPVTSLETGLTYKNYFCAVCNGDSLEANLVFWDIRLKGNLDVLSGPNIPNLTFDSEYNTWMASDNQTANDSSAVTVELHTPITADSLVKTCTANIILKCSESWTEASVAEKCSSYMASIYISTSEGIKLYRNPHCAICNYESLAHTVCSVFKVFRFKVSDAVFAGLFVLEDRRKTCKGDRVYDRLADRCRVLRCPKKKRQVVKAGKCVDIDT